jgi:hypothetical protein
VKNFIFVTLVRLTGEETVRVTGVRSGAVLAHPHPKPFESMMSREFFYPGAVINNFSFGGGKLSPSMVVLAAV